MKNGHQFWTRSCQKFLKGDIRVIVGSAAPIHKDITMPVPGIEDKVAFLSRPEAYPDSTQSVEVRQTHMSWLFLTDKHVWKLKKPVRTEYLDFSTVRAR